MITQTTNLNLIPGGVLPRINVSQYDKGSRTLVFNLYNGSASFSVPVGASVTIQGTKPDNTAFQYACTFSDSTVTADLEQQMSVLAGEVTCELVITQSVDGEAVILGTCNFIINVEKSAVSDDTVISDTDLPLIAQAVEAAAEAQASEEAAALSATNARNSADSAEDSAEDSEAYAVGTRNGVDVGSADPAYHNNAKYYAAQTAEAIENLDVTDTAVAGSYITAVSETDGLISVTREAADATPTENSKKMVTSGGVYADTQNIYKANGVLGAKNLLPMTLANLKLLNTSGTWSDNVYSIFGITFTINLDSDKNVSGINVNGLATDDIPFYLSNSIFLENGKRYIYTTGNPNATTSTFFINIIGIESFASAYTFTANSSTLNSRIFVRNTTTVTDETFYPMIRLASDPDDTYVPYAMTNRELTTEKANNSAIAPVESGTTASQAYAANDFFIMDGTLYKVISGIAQGGTITVNTNCTATTISEILTALLNA